MSEWTFVIIGLALVLGGANWFLSRLPRKEGVNISFIPPSNAPEISSSFESKIDAHIQSTNQKISMLFSRIELVERDLLHVKSRASTDAQSWMETVPVRKRKRS